MIRLGLSDLSNIRQGCQGDGPSKVLYVGKNFFPTQSCQRSNPNQKRFPKWCHCSHPVLTNCLTGYVPQGSQVANVAAVQGFYKKLASGGFPPGEISHKGIEMIKRAMAYDCNKMPTKTVIVNGQRQQAAINYNRIPSALCSQSASDPSEKPRLYRKSGSTRFQNTHAYNDSALVEYNGFSYSLSVICNDSSKKSQCNESLLRFIARRVDCQMKTQHKFFEQRGLLDRGDSPKVGGEH